jgi:hypothetical protein
VLSFQPAFHNRKNDGEACYIVIAHLRGDAPHGPRGQLHQEGVLFPSDFCDELRRPCPRIMGLCGWSPEALPLDTKAPGARRGFRHEDRPDRRVVWCRILHLLCGA